MVRRLLMNRRSALGLGFAGLAGLAASQIGRLKQHHINPADQNLDGEKLLFVSDREFEISSDSSLRERAAKKGILFGTAGDTYHLRRESDYAEVIAQECSIFVAENDLKWSTLRPSPDEFNFERGDWLADFANRNNMLYRGHTLLWDQALPPWFESTVNSQNAESFLVNHIDRVVRHYTGQLHSWDVVNEAIAVTYSQRPDRLASSPWFQFLGKDYIDLAFRVAAEADPSAMLVYNERWLDYDTQRDRDQRAATLNLLEYLKAKGTPVHALGIQAHLIGNETRFNPNQIRQFLRDVASMGLKILITELDVSDNGLPEAVEERDRRVAAAYEDYLSVVLDEPAVIAVITWGLSDRHSWRSMYGSIRPLPLDTNLNRKLAWNAIARALDNAPSRDT